MNLNHHEKRQQLRRQIASLKQQLSEKEKEYNELENIALHTTTETNLSRQDIVRYSRQIILPEVGVKGQLKLNEASVLIVGAGGLGCPAALYLAGAGIGCIGIVDYDEVEESNLHRQLLHSETSLGLSKVESAYHALMRLNSRLKIVPIKIQLNSNNALSIIQDYSVVVDATDNVATRYLLNDACVLLQRPLVSGSALQMEGQLTVYNYNGGACYRCLYPEPPPPETVSNCGDSGVLGVVPGVIGILQALEVIKIILGQEGTLNSKLLLFDAVGSIFRTIKLRPKNLKCKVCGEDPSITQLMDYEQFCGAAANDKDQHVAILDDGDRITASDLNGYREKGHPLVIIDVRSAAEFAMCSISDSINIPLREISQLNSLSDLQKKFLPVVELTENTIVCCVCRRGNDSQRAVHKLQPLLFSLTLTLCDLKGGLHSWASTIDCSFPVY